MASGSITTPKFISDQDMEKLQPQQSVAPQPQATPKFISDDDMNKMQPQELPKDKFFMQPALESTVVPVGRAIDRYTGAPTRAALSEAVAGKGLLAAGQKFKSQFGENPENAPTGKEIAQQMGIPNTSASEVAPKLYSESGYFPTLQKGGLLDPTASGAAGLGIDIGADWTNLIPAGAVAKGIGHTAVGAGKVGLEAGIEAAKEGGRIGAKALDIASGSRLGEKALQTASGAADIAKTGAEAAKRTSNAIFDVLRPSVSPNYKQLSEIASKNGIDPKTLSAGVEFGPTSSVSRLERAIAEGPSGEKYLAKHEAGRNQITEAINNTVSKASGGVNHNPITAGEALSDSIGSAQKRVFDSVDLTYDKVRKFAPGLMINKEDSKTLDTALSGMEKKAQGMLSRGLGPQKAQAKELLGIVQSARNANGSYKQLNEFRSYLGDTLQQMRDGKNPLLAQAIDEREVSDLYKHTSEALLGTIKKDVNPDFAKEISDNNKTMSDWFNDRSQLKNITSGKMAPEKVLDTVLADSRKIDVLKNRLTPQEFQGVKAAVLQKVIKRNADGEVLYDSTAKAMRQNKPLLEKVFDLSNKEDASQLQSLADLMNLGKAHGDPVLSYSGTGASNSFRELGGQVKRAAIDESTLELMKNKARKSALPKPESKGLLDAPASTPSGDSGGLLNTQLAGRGPWEKAGKKAQSVAPSFYRKDDRQRQ